MCVQYSDQCLTLNIVIDIKQTNVIISRAKKPNNFRDVFHLFIGQYVFY